MKPRTRAERDHLNRSFYTAMVLPAIGEAARRTVPPPLVMSAALSEIEGHKPLHYILGRSRWPRRPR